MKRPLSQFLLCLALYLLGVVAYSVWTIHHEEKLLLADIDHQLNLAALSLKYVLPPDFHDRATGPGAISYEEELRNRQAINSLASETPFAWLYTLAEAEGKFYFTAPTVTEEEAKEQKRWYWHPYDDIPEEFVLAFGQNKPAYVEYTDQWGHFRSIALPRTSPGGRRYLACVDFDISYLQGQLRNKLWESILTGVYFFALVLPFILLFANDAKRLRIAREKLDQQNQNLERQVAERTASLQREKDQAESLVLDLQKALAELQQAQDSIKTLSGMMPICSHCNKIRDDQGYWSKLEEFMRDHFDASFSHSICPDCAARLHGRNGKQGDDS